MCTWRVVPAVGGRRAREDGVLSEKNSCRGRSEGYDEEVRASVRQSPVDELCCV